MTAEERAELKTLVSTGKANAKKIKALFRFRVDADECFDEGPEQCLAA